MGQARTDRGDHQSGLGSGSGIKELFSLANAFKEGDRLVGGTADERVRADARRALSAATIGDIRRFVFVNDGVSANLDRSRDRRFDAELDSLTIGRLRTTLLGPHLAAWASTYRDSLASEVIAAVVKVLTDDELASVARRLFNPLDGSGTVIGSPQHFGSRIQPNSAGDDETEILFSILDGLSYGCGDVIIGLNPAADDIDTIVRLEQLLERVVRTLDLPTRYCVLSDLVKQHRARTRTHIDVAFQSLAGTSRGLNGMVGLDVDGVVDLACDFDALYFETGQGSEVTNGAAEGLDMVTLEARTYGVARHIKWTTGCRWMIVNDVAGFIGPEVFRTAAQLERACLEDVVMAKLHGLTMGLDVCATFHMGIAPRALRELTERIVVSAAPAYLMAVAGHADPMLGYMTTSFRDHPFLRARAGRRMTSAMEQRLVALTACTSDGASRAGPATIARLSAVLGLDGWRRLVELQERGLDIGLDAASPDALIDAIYANAQRALYATITERVIRDASPLHLRTHTAATSRDDYLAHPSAGERLREEDARAVAALARERSTQVQIVVSDGLNANAINEHLRDVLPQVRWLLSSQARHVASTDVVVQNGRVRVGYQIGGLMSVDVLVHFIGERPGTGLNTMSAYLTYGRDTAGQLRWNGELDHSATSAICGIHPKGKPPQDAAGEIARTVGRILEQRRSGVALDTNQG
jgi:ethanolamine ammonia-lyase large subunit